TLTMLCLCLVLSFLLLSYFPLYCGVASSNNLKLHAIFIFDTISLTKSTHKCQKIYNSFYKIM
ncbi:MAG: hypothetical protein IJ371_05390, partial [Clostridia bacterium]|nr:hypothetical protein [Clostridia bacterium]